MGFIDRLVMVAKSNLNEIVTKAEDPAKILEQSINDMEENLARSRQAVAQSIAALKLQEEQYKESAAQAQEWEKRAILAIQKGEENLAREALSRKKTHADLAATLKASLDQQSRQVETLKKNLIATQSKISEAKTAKEILKVRLRNAEAQEHLNNLLGTVNNDSASATFQRMSEIVRRKEIEVSVISELGSDDLEAQFAKLNAGSEIEDEYAALRAKVLSSSPAPQGALPPSDTPKPSVGATIDAELEALRRQMGK